MEKNENSNLIYLKGIINTNKNKINEDLQLSSTKINTKKRYDILDNFKGILIFMVVFAHFLFEYSNSHINSLSRKFVVYIYFFHMEAFIFISGFVTSENSIKIINAIKFLILYYIFNFSFSFIFYLYNKSTINFLYPLYSYWYLLSLFYWRILINYLYDVPFIFVISILIFLLEGYWECFTNVLSIYKTIVFFPYFLSGYEFAKMNIIEKILIWKNRKLLFFIFITIYCLFSYLLIIYINNNIIDNATLLIEHYNKNNTIIKRIIKMLISSLFIILFILFLPNYKLPFINKWGRNSLYIYLFHRFFTILAQKELFSKMKNSIVILEYSGVFALLSLFIFGSDFVTKFCNLVLNSIHQNLIDFNNKRKNILFYFCLSLIFLMMIKPISLFYIKKDKDIKPYDFDNSYKSQFNNFNYSLKEFLDNSIRISYVGDLILLKDNVIGAKNNITGKYEFDEMFQYTSKHFHESDLSIGVYEGPSAGNNTSYSTSNYDDGIPLSLNFPDEFAESVKKAGINLVTTANNHLLDKNLSGAIRTLDVLDKYNISHVGSYRNYEEKNQIFIINIKDIKIAVLAYTSIMNNYKIETLYGKYGYLTNIIPRQNNKYYNQLYKNVENDFFKAKKYCPDIIIVLVHMGDEFLHHTTEFQNKWNKIFSSLGADIVLGDHSHAVQPLQYIGKTLIVNSPGNFANSYIKRDGDSTAIIDIYIHKKIKKVMGASAMPMYTKKLRNKYFTAIPIYDLIKNKSIPLSSNEWKRVEEIQLMSTRVLVGREFGIKEAKKEYFFINNMYYDFNETESNFCKILDNYSDSKVYKYINNSNSITFIGDSITEGTKNGFHPWYEPMMNYFKDKKIINISKGGYTTKLIFNNYKNDIIKSKSDLYVIALGTNDIRYRDPSICAMNPKEYIHEIEKIVNLIDNHAVKFIFITPWISTFDDNVSKLNHLDKKKLIKEYSLALKRFTEIYKFLYIDPNEYLEKMILQNKDNYMVDFIHPNSKLGIQLYCQGVLNFKL